MITDRTIVCVASDWDYDPTSKHQIMRILARRNRVVWVNYRGTRRPTATRSDGLNVLNTLGRVVRGVRRIGPTMVQVTPLVVPAPTRASLKRINERTVLRAVRRAMARFSTADSAPVQVWTFAPDTAFLARKFDEERFVYYCVDEHAEFEGFDAEYVARAEREQIDRSDVVITTSAALYDSKHKMHPNTHLIRHGVDAAHFGRALTTELPPPSELAGVPRPRIGFFGVLHHWVDCDLLAAVARRRPQYTFVLIGEVLTDVSALKVLPNVLLLGRRPYESLPAYCKTFDVALLPFKHTAMTRSANPIKMREYLAAGVPVVSTPLPEARLYPRDIVIADGIDGFAAACDRVLGEVLEGRPGETAMHERRRRAARVAGESWEAVVERLSSIVMEMPEAVPAPAAFSDVPCELPVPSVA